jgi:hypothetical protein
MMPERESAMAKAAAAEHMSGTESAAMEYSAAAAKAAAVEDRAAATVSTASAGVETTAAANMATSTAASAMPAADFSHQPVSDGFRCRRRAWIDQRQRFCALDRCRRQHQHRGSRKAQATDEAAPGIWNPSHV